MVIHSKSIRIFAYVCAAVLIPVYICGSLALFYTTYKSIPHYDFLITLFIGVVSIAASFFGLKSMYLLVRFLKTLKLSLEFDENGIVLNSASSLQIYSWDALKNSKDYPSCQIFCLIDRDGNHLFSIWEYAANYDEFREMVLEKIDI